MKFHPIFIFKLFSAEPATNANTYNIYYLCILYYVVQCICTYICVECLLCVGKGLMEIVTEPDLSSGSEAAAFVNELQLLLKTLSTGDG